jgi:S1-C subfamily serine protease
MTVRRAIAVLGALLALSVSALAGCGQPAAAPRVEGSLTERVFADVVPSVVAVLNDDGDMREDEAKRTLHDMGVAGHSPKSVVDVSLRKEPTPHGTGFLIEGGLVLTAAHVVRTPTRIKVITRTGQSVAAEVVKLDEMRDVAVLRPKVPLLDVPPIDLMDEKAQVGHKIWALGHTGGGMWALSWGITEGVTSGVVELLGAELVVHDAAVYPGFSGGPVVMLDANHKPRVVGVNHAILFTGGMTPIATISSASSVKDIRAVLAGQPHPMEAQLADFRKSRLKDVHADLFVTNNLSVHKDPHQLTTAAIYGNTRVVEADADVRIPVVGIVFGKEPGAHELEFRVVDPKEVTVLTEKKTYDLPMHERVGFVTADLHFAPKSAGRYEILAFQGKTQVGHTDIWVEDPNDDKDLVNDNDIDDVEGGEPKVSVVVAASGNTDPLTLLGIRAGWSEWHYPRRVEFTWFARGSRGWIGTNVAISAYVLDEQGHIVGRGVGCIQPEIRPEVPWSCMGAGGTPLISGPGSYDVVFAINDRPVALWPMEAIVRTDGSGGLEQWVDQLKKQGTFRKKEDPKPEPQIVPTPTPSAKPAPKQPPTSAAPKPPKAGARPKP